LEWSEEVEGSITIQKNNSGDGKITNHTKVVRTFEDKSTCKWKTIFVNQIVLLKLITSLRKLAFIRP